METNLSGLLATDDLSQGEVERLQLDEETLAPTSWSHAWNAYLASLLTISRVTSSNFLTRHVLDSFPGPSLMRAPSAYKAWVMRNCHPRNFYSRNTLVSAIREKFHPRNKPAIRYTEALCNATR